MATPFHETARAVLPNLTADNYRITSPTYPVWQRPFYLLALMTNLHGPCDFHIEMRLEEMEQDVLILKSDKISLNLTNDPLRIYPVSIMMKSAKLPRPGAYRLSFVWAEEELAKETIHAR